jgi:hypothetical protein
MPHLPLVDASCAFAEIVAGRNDGSDPPCRSEQRATIGFGGSWNMAGSPARLFSPPNAAMRSCAGRKPGCAKKLFSSAASTTSPVSSRSMKNILVSLLQKL